MIILNMKIMWGSPFSIFRSVA